MNKIFQDFKAKRKFIDIYEMLEFENVLRTTFCTKIKEEAAKKVESLEDNLTEFYLTEKDVEKIFKQLEKNHK